MKLKVLHRIRTKGNNKLILKELNSITPFKASSTFKF